MTVDACIIDTVKDILFFPNHQVPIPDTPVSWNAFWSDFRGKASRDAKKLVEALGSEFFQFHFQLEFPCIELVAFLEEAQKLHSQASSLWADPHGIPSLASVLLDRPADDSMTKLDDELGVLLGSQDDTFTEMDGDSFLVLENMLRVLNFDARSELVHYRSFATDDLTQGLLKVLSRSKHKHTATFVTENGICGMALSGIQIGDKIAKIFYRSTYEIPVILRQEREDKYSMVCVATVSENWDDHCQRKNLLEDQEVVII